uniref:Transmembrane protein n=1 Tax=Anopheles dirus TaxID=7168 RepID=A0A182NBC4_9DIPT
MAVTLKQEVNLSRRACRLADGSGEQSRARTAPPAENGCSGSSRHPSSGPSGCGERGANSFVPMPAKVLSGTRCAGRSDSLLACLLAAVVMCTGQVLLKLRDATGGWALHQPRIGRLCIYVVLCGALLSNNAFVLARPNLSAPASGEKGVAVPVGQLSPLDLAFDTGSGPLTSASQLKRSAEAAAIIASTAPSSDAGGHGDSPGDELVAGDHGRAEGEEHGEEHVVERYPVSQVDFSRVETPFVIGVWILSASIAKI